jgi:hypothetical protein
MSGYATCRLSNRSLTRCKSSLRCRKDHVVERTEPSVHDVMLLITKSRELGAIYVTGVPKVDHRLRHGAPFSLALSSFVDRLYPVALAVVEIHNGDALGDRFRRVQRRT